MQKTAGLEQGRGFIKFNRGLPKMRIGERGGMEISHPAAEPLLRILPQTEMAR
jgi:hypothetical protein